MTGLPSGPGLFRPSGSGYQYGQVWYGWVDEDTPLLRVIVCIPLSMLEPNRYGCNVLPEWDRHFHRSGWGR